VTERAERPAQLAFALATIALGLLGLIKGDFAPVWQPSPKNLPARELLVYGSACISVFAGAGLLFRRTASVASRVLLLYLLAWLVLFRMPRIIIAPADQGTWSGLGETAVIVAGAWVLYASFNQRWFAGQRGLRLARLMYGLALIPFGQAHFRYLKETASLVPSWLPAHIVWASITGAAFIAAGLAVIAGVWARLAATLSALQLAVFTLLVWVPIVFAQPDEYQRAEFVISCVLTICAWVVADSYRGMRWLAVGER
jgi:uncharacterized membrane protein